MRRIYFEVSPKDHLPEDYSNVRCKLKYPDGSIKEAKVYYVKGFKLRHGKKDCEVFSWFKPVELSEETFHQLFKQLTNE